jgi:hypothetical protein
LSLEIQLNYKNWFWKENLVGQTKFTLWVKGTGHTLDTLKSAMEPEDCSLCRLSYGSVQQ